MLLCLIDLILRNYLWGKYLYDMADGQGWNMPLIFSGRRTHALCAREGVKQSTETAGAHVLPVHERV